MTSRPRGPCCAALLTTFIAVLTVLAACTAAPPHAAPPHAAPPAAPGPNPAAPWPQRPVVDLTFDMAPDLSSATGHETVVFTPDLPVCELVFRAWPNMPSTAGQGNALVVTGATVQGRTSAPVMSPAGAPPGAPGTLVELPLPGCVPAGQSVRAELGFALRLGADSDERMGTSPATGTAWFGSGFPLLAWVRGQGWIRDDAVTIPSETATSEDFRLDALRVIAPTRAEVSGTGRADVPVPGPQAGTTAHVFHADAVRDVSVAVGAYRVQERDVAGARLHLFTPASGTRADPQRWAQEIDGTLGRLEQLLGPSPYADLWVVIVPPLTSGIEYPGALQFGDLGTKDVPELAAHELAHQWFYGLVGNDQARDPWLDEGFATYAQAVVDDSPGEYRLGSVPRALRGGLGDPMGAWSGRGPGAYYSGVYVQGAAALLAARRRVGAGPFDAAVRAYVTTNAHRVATPADVAHAFAGLPVASDLLAGAGAFATRR
ncbi:M1 family aminopeptidase [Actinomycetospora sp. TBRC 11914]|uniref:M1 family aminopeptidase n=1 Tax=Actinomycetospora sp. TBRC 11914 TaxID=2729387 RepID=UPI00145CB238|nr:M1 family aminopeptidase [Actinomycetospora sp. TBRC 11914]NMO92335.1 M1 family metallopeptidase [Actinomycetospora sp. TBRC 11914]